MVKGSGPKTSSIDALQALATEHMHFAVWQNPVFTKLACRIMHIKQRPLEFPTLRYPIVLHHRFGSGSRKDLDISRSVQKMTSWSSCSPRTSADPEPSSFSLSLSRLLLAFSSWAFCSLSRCLLFLTFSSCQHLVVCNTRKRYFFQAVELLSVQLVEFRVDI